MTLVAVRGEPTAAVTRAWLPPVLVAIVFYALLAVVAGRSDGFQYLQLMRPGAYFAHPGVLLPGQHAEPYYGYDGQFYFYLAEDPWLRNPATVASLDGSFRYRRILYPLLAWLLSGGNRALVPRALFAINLAAALLTVLLVARAASAARAPTSIALVVALYPGLWLPVVLDTTETLQTVLAAAALVTGSALPGLLACFAKESGAAVLVARCVAAFRSAGWRAALLPAVLLGVYAVWVLAVRFLVLPGVTGWGGRTDLLVDFQNRHGDLLYMATHGSLASRLLPTATALLFLAAIARLAITRDQPAVASALFAVVVLALGVDTWIDALEYFRYAGFLVVLVALSWIQVRDRLGSAVLVVAAAVSLLSVVALAQLVQ